MVVCGVGSLAMGSCFDVVSLFQRARAREEMHKVKCHGHGETESWCKNPKSINFHLGGRHRLTDSRPDAADA